MIENGTKDKIKSLGIDLSEKLFDSLKKNEDALKAFEAGRSSSVLVRGFKGTVTMTLKYTPDEGQ